MAQIKLQDESGDKKYFTQLPSIILNHSTANDQALYWQMKRYAGEDGQCFATEKTLMRKLGIGKKAYDRSLEYLLKRKWIMFIGMTNGKTRPIKTYSIVDIWKENIMEYEKISSESTVSFNTEISSESEGDKSQKQYKISPKSNIEEEPTLVIVNKEDILLNKLSDKDSLLKEKTNEPINKDYEHFLIWYKFYPRKVGKPNAYKVWKRLKPDTELKRKMVTMVLEHSKSKQWQDINFIPHPSTWLSQRRWEDKLPMDDENV